MFQYRELSVESPLAEFVKKLWILDNSTNSNIVNNKTVLPNGCFNIAIVHGQGACVKINKAVTSLREGIYFCGQMTNAVLADVFPFTKISLIQLYAWTPCLCISMDMSRFTDLIVELKDSKKYLPNKIALDDEFGIKGLLNETFCKFKLDRTRNAVVRKSCEHILKSNGDISVTELVEWVGCSTRVLQKQFKHAVGLSPKMYIKIIKLREVVDHIAFPETAVSSMTELALDKNYYDQAHFTNVFREIVKTTPKRFIPGNYLLSLKEKK